LADAKGEDVEAFIVDLLARHKPATASNRYRLLANWIDPFLAELTSSPPALLNHPLLRDPPGRLARDWFHRGAADHASGNGRIHRRRMSGNPGRGGWTHERLLLFSDQRFAGDHRG
jgi:hypothetical protein